MTRALLPCLLLALGTPRQESEQPEQSVAEEIAALIESTNALDSFHCVWLGEEEGQRLELAYEAPEKGRVSFVTPEKVQERCFDEERLYFRDEDERWRACELPRSEPRAKLDELFPTGQRLGPGFEFFLGGEVGLACLASFQPGGRDALLAWLGLMEHESAMVVREDDVLVWTIKNCELRIARDSGFPRQITVRAEERSISLTLEQCSLDEEAPVAPPEDAEPAAEDDIERMLLGMWALPSLVRSDAFARVGAQLEAETLEWNARTRADWHELQVALHGQNIEWALVEWMKELLEYIDEAVLWARATLEESDTPEVRAALATHFDELEQGLAPGFEQAPANYLASLQELEDARDELLEAERETILRLHDEQVTQPILEYLAEEREALLGE